MRHNFISEEEFKVIEQRVSRGGVKEHTANVGRGRGAVTERQQPNRTDGTTVKSSARTFHATNFPITIALVGQHISGKNRVGIRRDGHHYPRKQFINWRAQAYLQVLEQIDKPPRIEQPVVLKCWYWPGDQRTRDVTGMLDALFYLLVYAGILKNDGLIWDCRWSRYPETKFPSY